MKAPDTGNRSISSFGIRLKRSALVRLIIMPLLIFGAWLAETYLLEGSIHLFSRSNPPALVLYTIVVCILIGMVLPLILIRSSFMSGAVNMFQVGFRSWRRTIAACALASLIGYTAFLLYSPNGSDRLANVHAFLFLLPTAIASVMICWVLVGTHIQAFFRSGGMVISILYGVIVTAILFDITSFAHRGFVSGQSTSAIFFLIGLVIAFFFFSVRDVYASGILLSVCMVYAFSDILDPIYLHSELLPVYITALMAVAALLLAHGYFSRYYVTIKLPDK